MNSLGNMKPSFFFFSFVSCLHFVCKVCQETSPRGFGGVKLHIYRCSHVSRISWLKFNLTQSIVTEPSYALNILRKSYRRLFPRLTYLRVYWPLAVVADKIEILSNNQDSDLHTQNGLLSFSLLAPEASYTTFYFRLYNFSCNACQISCLPCHTRFLHSLNHRKTVSIFEM